VEEELEDEGRLRPDEGAASEAFFVSVEGFLVEGMEEEEVVGFFVVVVAGIADAVVVAIVVGFFKTEATVFVGVEVVDVDVRGGAIFEGCAIEEEEEFLLLLAEVGGCEDVKEGRIIEGAGRADLISEGLGIPPEDGGLMREAEEGGREAEEAEEVEEVEADLE
jgi:hypothetical protein